MKSKRASLIVSAALMLLASDAYAVSICLDPGHGGSDPGATGCNLVEAEINLSVATKLKSMLEKAGYTVYMTRTTDTYVSLAGRTEYANNKGVDTFASIHTNSASATSATGIETYCYTGNTSKKSGTQAKAIQNNMLAVWPLANRGVKEANFYVVHYTNMPATLTELAFIVNCSTDAQYLKSDTHRNSAAKAHCEALVSTWGGDPAKCSGSTTPQPSTGYVYGYVFEGETLNTNNPKVAGATYKCGGVTLTSSATDISKFTVPTGAYTCEASKEGYTSNKRSDCSPVTAGQISYCSINIPKKAAAPAKGTATGSVKDSASGSKVAANVTVAGGSSVNYDGNKDWAFSLDAGTYTITATATGYDQNSVSCKVTSGGTTACPITLNPKKGTIAGSVTDAETGAKIASTVMLGTNTAAYDGKTAWSFNVAAGTYTITAESNGYELGSVSCTVGRGETKNCDIALKPVPKEDEKKDPGMMRGTIRDSETDALIAGTVYIEGTGYSSDYNGTGSWQFYLPAGQYTVRGESTGYKPSTVQCAAISGEVVSCMLALAPETIAVTGNVIDAVSQSNVSAQITISNEKGVVETLSSSTDKAWSLELKPGTYTITAKAEGYVDAKSTCKVAAGQENVCNTSIYSKADANATLAGSVYDARSEGYLIDAKVTVENGTTVNYTPHSTSCDNDACKTWRIDDVVPGMYVVTASAEGYHSNTASCQAVTIDIESGIDYIPCKIALTAKDGSNNATNIETGAEPIIKLESTESDCSVTGIAGRTQAAPYGIFAILATALSGLMLRRRKED